MRRFVLAATVAGLSLVAIPRPALAVTKTPVTFCWTIDTFVPGTYWDSGHMSHGRGELFSGPIAGDLQGTESAVNNFNVELYTGKAEIWGTFTVTASDVTWEGRYSGNYGTSAFSGQGTDGSQLLGDFSVQDCGFQADGIILDP